MPKAKAAAKMDSWLIFSFITLLLFGLVMVASSSIALAEREHNDVFYFFNRQLIAVAIGLVAGVFVYLIPVKFWMDNSKYILIAGFILLTLVFIPGIGKTVNGSARWINLGVFNLQVSELMKLIMMIYIAGYLVRKKALVQHTYQGFASPVVVLAITGILILMEPDLGATIVITATTMGMLLIAGAKLIPFIMMLLGVVVMVVLLVIYEPYRLTRLVSFSDPWEDPLKSGFQLTQSLMAYGRGDWFGVGLGHSLQKQFYLPEAHTDFIFSIIAEELGVAGVICIILLFLFLVFKLMMKTLDFLKQKKLFEAYILGGTAVWIGTQSFINMGVSMGILPTKGLTLPFISYGGSSMIVMMLLIALILRIDYENHTRKPFDLFNWRSAK